LDVHGLAASYSVDDRVRVDEVLRPDTAAAVRNAAASLPFDHLFFSGGQARLATASQMAALTHEQRRQLQQELNDMARQGVGFLYDGYRMENERLERAPQILRDLFEFINSDTMLSLVRQISGISEIYSADGHFTRFVPGNYLTRHSDNVVAEQRRIAYVLSLTPAWHPDWGGLLQFFEPDGTPRDAWEPRFGSLSLFDVRHVHSVTYVTPWAEAPRLSLTGWFSSRRT
jgi:Rps23 Pro-64 3,4-dihydroxylase Tpa1-like proline 4-hydroxylase